MAYKVGSLVEAGGQRFVLLSRAPLVQWFREDTGEQLLSPLWTTPIKDYVGRYFSLLGDERVLVEKRVTSEGKGSAWWVQDAATGALMDFSVRESDMSLVVGPLTLARV